MQYQSNFQWHLLQKYFKSPKIPMGSQKVPNSQSKLEKKEQSWSHHISQFQNIQQSSITETE